MHLKNMNRQNSVLKFTSLLNSERKMNYKLLPLVLLISSNTIAADVAELETISVGGQEINGNLSPEVTSTSTLDTGVSEINLNIEELKGIAGTQGDPLGAIKVLPGVVAADNVQSGDGAGFFVRGSSANENAIWVDGLPIGYIYHLGGRFSVLNSDTISNFNTYLGGFGVEFGDRLGGVVSVNTRDPLRQKLNQSYQIGFYDASFKLEGPISEKSSGYFAFRKSYFDLLLPQVGKLPGSENTYTKFPQFWDLQAKYHYELDKGKLDFSVFAADDQIKINIKDEKETTPDPAIAGDLGSKSAFQTYGVKWQQSLSPNLEQTVRAGLLSRQTGLVLGTQLKATDPNQGGSYTVNSNSNSFFILPSWAWEKGSGQRWKAGIDLYKTNFKVDGYIIQPCREGQADCTVTGQEGIKLDQDSTAKSTAPYIELTQEITPDLFATFGIRYKQTQVGKFEDSQTSPRLNLEYDLTDKVRLTASWGKFVQLPRGYEMIDGIGNPDLVMTQAEHRIVGVKFELSDLWSGQVEMYHKPMTKLIVSRDSPENYANEGKGFAKGVDVFFKKKWKDRSFGWISYSYLETERTDESEGSKRLFSGDQPHTLNVVYNQPFGGSWHNWIWGMNLKAHSGLPYTKIIGRESSVIPGSTTTAANCQTDPSQDGCYWKPKYDKSNGERMPVYLSLDLSMERKWKYSSWDLTTRFELLNVTGLFRPNTIGYEYEEDYSNYNKPDEVSDFPFFPSFSIRANF